MSDSLVGADTLSIQIPVGGHRVISGSILLLSLLYWSQDAPRTYLESVNAGMLVQVRGYSRADILGGKLKTEIQIEKCYRVLSTSEECKKRETLQLENANVNSTRKRGKNKECGERTDSKRGGRKS